MSLPKLPNSSEPVKVYVGERKDRVLDSGGVGGKGCWPQKCLDCSNHQEKQTALTVHVLGSSKALQILPLMTSISLECPPGPQRPVPSTSFLIRQISVPARSQDQRTAKRLSLQMAQKTNALSPSPFLTANPAPAPELPQPPLAFKCKRHIPLPNHPES